MVYTLFYIYFIYSAVLFVFLPAPILNDILCEAVSINSKNSAKVCRVLKCCHDGKLCRSPWFIQIYSLALIFLHCSIVVLLLFLIMIWVILSRNAIGMKFCRFFFFFCFFFIISMVLSVVIRWLCSFVVFLYSLHFVFISIVITVHGGSKHVWKIPKRQQRHTIYSIAYDDSSTIATTTTPTLTVIM